MNNPQQMRKDGWIQIKSGRWIRRSPKGGWDGVWEQNIKASLAATAEIRKATHENPKLLETTTGCGTWATNPMV